MWRLCHHFVCRVRVSSLAAGNILQRSAPLPCAPARTWSSASSGALGYGSWPRHYGPGQGMGLGQGMGRVQGHVGSSLACPSRHKSSKSDKRGNRRQDFSDDEESDEEEELESAADFRDMRVNVSSLRLDAILKAGLNMSRNKVESAFYDSKIRVNGQKVMKKSKQLQEEDEVDIIKAVSSKNPALLDISRVVVLSIGSYNEDTDKIRVRLRKYPQLLVEKYEDDFETPS
ncbi:mitochondrial transcription rescue factor 1-like [Penaeus chinensis]|uniref:mitochondrial transcription rescue factor 1-like n=1 Tax=Penaeus chinensis TaxID=139456 RepID=UPI001FB6E789|nr:mitochondrial transcription rescue factor 1-like [Penaeus chinensis]